MNDETILVTGAAGFIGSRLTHRLALEDQASVVPLVHSVSGAGTMRIGRLPVEIEQGSILDGDRMASLLADCDAVINCAHGGQRVTVDGTRTLLAAAEAQNIDTYVHLSSAVVHGHDASGTVTAETPLAPDTAYAKRKAAAEQVIRDRDGEIEPTVFRPCIVYGPHSPWVRKPLSRLRAGAVLADGGVGELNQVYVDNLVDALLAAVGSPEAAGETFTIADDEPVTWAQYYRALGGLLEDHPPIQARSTTELAVSRRLRYLKESVVPPLRFLGGVLTAPDTLRLATEQFKQTPWGPTLYQRLPEELQEEILDRAEASDGGGAGARTETPEATYPYPPENQAKMQSTRGRVSNQKLTSVLDWEPRVSFGEAIEMVGEWAAYEGLVGTRPQSLAPGEHRGPGPAELGDDESSSEELPAPD